MRWEKPSSCCGGQCTAGSWALWTCRLVAVPCSPVVRGAGERAGVLSRPRKPCHVSLLCQTAEGQCVAGSLSVTCSVEMHSWEACLSHTVSSLPVAVGSLQKGSCSSQSGMIPGSWQHKMKLQLILKSSKAYYVLSDAAMSLHKYGRALRYIKLALQSHGRHCLEEGAAGTVKPQA